MTQQDVGSHWRRGATGHGLSLCCERVLLAAVWRRAQSTGRWISCRVKDDAKVFSPRSWKDDVIICSSWKDHNGWAGGGGGKFNNPRASQCGRELEVSVPKMKPAVDMWADAQLGLVRTPGLLRKETHLKGVWGLPAAQTMLRNLYHEELEMHLSNSQINAVNPLAIN